MKSDNSNTVDRNIKSPRYHQVYSAIRGWIFDATYTPGAKLPAESELCKVFGVSRITSRKAIDLLVQEGLLLRVQGKGTYVSDDLAAAPNIGDMQQLIRKTQRLSKKSRVDNIEFKEVVGDDDTCVDLKLPPKSKLREISYVRYIDNRPIGCRFSYMPLDSGIDISAKDLKSEQMLAILEKKGIKISGVHQLLGACTADPIKASLLQTTVGEPLVRIRLIVLDERARPVERSTAFYLADRYEHHVFLTRNQTHESRVAS